MPNPLRQATGAVGGATRWAHAAPGEAHDQMARARAALRQKFLDQADPDGVLPVEERERRADGLRKVAYARMALAKAQKERAARQTREAAAERAQLDALVTDDHDR